MTPPPLFYLFFEFFEFQVTKERLQLERHLQIANDSLQRNNGVDLQKYLSLVKYLLVKLVVKWQICGKMANKGLLKHWEFCLCVRVDLQKYLNLVKYLLVKLVVKWQICGKMANKGLLKQWEFCFLVRIDLNKYLGLVKSLLVKLLVKWQNIFC